MKRIVFFLILIFPLTSCKEEIKVISKNIKDENFALDNSYIISKKLFKLDSITPANSPSVQFINERYVSILNVYEKKIHFYEYNSGKEVFVWPPNNMNIEGNISGSQIQSQDSIFLYDYYSQKLSLYDSLGNKISDYSLLRNKNLCKHPPAPHLSTYTPFNIIENKLYILGWVAGEYKDEDRPLLTTLDLKTKKYYYSLTYPETYMKYNWGGAHARFVFGTFFNNRKSLLLSFAASHNLMEINLHTMQKYSHVTSSSFIDTIPYYSMKKNVIPESIDRQNYYNNNSFYGPVIYDKYRDIFYLLTTLKSSAYSENMNNCPLRNRNSLIALDRNFSKLSEVIIKDHDYMSFFVTKEGLHIRKERKGEDSIEFTIFKLK